MSGPRSLIMMSLLALVVVACSGDGDRASIPTAPPSPSAADADEVTVAGRVVTRGSAVVAVDVPERAEPGDRSYAVFQTKPNSSCQLEIVDADGRSLDRLPPALADAEGLVRWTWTPERSAEGLELRVVCSGGQRGTAYIDVA